MPIEAALIKPVVDALMALFRESNDIKLKRNAEASLREAIRELLLANPDENKAQARIAIAKAAGILSEDVVLAEDMLQKHRATKAKTAGKTGSGRRRKPASADAPKTPEKAIKVEKADKADEATASATRKPRKPASKR